MGLAILCPGQGAQHPGMFGRWAAEPGARAVVEQVSALLGSDAACPSPRDAARWHANALAQPLLCGYALAAWRAVRPHLPAPVLFLGYSVGELAAHGCAGAFDAQTLLGLAQARARAMDGAAAAPQRMLALRGCPPAAAARLCGEFALALAIVNAPDHVVLGGPAAAVAAAAAAAPGLGVRHVRPLDVTVASHTPLLAPAVAPWRAALEAAAFRAPEAPVIAGIDAAPAATRARAIDTLARQVAETVRWSECMQSAREHGARAVLELGPGRGLTRMLNEDHPDLPARALDDFRSPAAARTWLERVLG